jgi:hypothetical protein
VLQGAFTSSAVDARACLNCLWLEAAVACLVLTGWAALGSPWWGLVVAAPVAADGRFANLAAAGGPDARAACLVALILLVWVKARLENRALTWPTIVTIGLIAGFAASANPIAAFPLAAYAAYAAGRSSGAARLARPAACVIIALLACLAAGGLPRWEFGLSWDGAAAGAVFRSDMPLYLGYLVPLAACAVCAWLAWRARHEAWFAAAALWAASLAAGAALTAHGAPARSALAIQAPLEVVSVMSAIAFFKSKRGGTMSVRVMGRAPR